MPDKDTRPYIVLAHEFPRHPKTQQLSDPGFRALIELWCYCNEYLTDGAIPKVLVDRQYKKAARELVNLGFMEHDNDDGYRMHDYLKHQKSKAEVEEFRAQKSGRASKGGHVKNHVKRGVLADDCRYCQEDYPDPASSSASSTPQAGDQPPF